MCWFEGDECISNRYMLMNLIAAASILLAKLWKMDSVPMLNEWKLKVLFFMSKLSTLCSVRLGFRDAFVKFKCPRKRFMDCKISEMKLVGYDQVLTSL